ncbi:MAG: type 4a pilus biogenesis protein PilO [Thermodesulfobacteriota bacterium]|nr:type 4a pilus biogenesis protein PilO [Thermodesulfobacteriota bacterium]
MEFDLKTIENIPVYQRVLIVVLVNAIILVGYLYLFYLPKNGEKGNLKRKMETLQVEVEKKQIIARKLPRFKKEVAILKRQVKIAVIALPSKEEIPSILTGISSTGRSSNLEFTLFKPRQEINKDFYAEIPIEINLTGNYINILNFFKQLSIFPRIVNVSDVKLKLKKSKGSDLKLSCLLTTFRHTGVKVEKKKRKKK